MNSLHDPMVVAWDVPAPWPRRCLTMRLPGDPRWAFRTRRRTNPENLGERVYPWWRPKGYRLVLASTEYGTGTLATIWHVEPGGRDSGEVCRHHYKGADGQFHADGSWRWHVRHWRLQFPWLQELRRFALTRCAWCGGPSRRRDRVNVRCAASDDHPQNARWWRGEPGLFHGNCTSVAIAHRTCVCSVPGLLEHRDYGTCARCGLFRAWRPSDRPAPDHDEITRALRTVPAGQRPSHALMAWVERIASERRAAEREAVD